MRDDEILGLGLVGVLITLLVCGLLAIIAGNITSQLLAPTSVAGPVGAAAALIVFIFLLIKIAEILFG